MVALRPGEMPEGVVLSPYLDAVATFEEVAGGAAAAPAWQAALRRWPRDSRPYLALGNLAYTRGSLAVAVDYYRRGLALDPGDPALGNNLASVLGEAGCPEQGRTLLQPIWEALPAGSRWRPVLAGTLAELAAQPELRGAAGSGTCPGK
jgi:predicted Zn-dependent protease